MNWLKRLFGIKTDFEIMMEHVDKSHARDIELIRAQMATIDRVVAARYDRPTFAQESHVQTSDPTPEDFNDVLTEGDDDQFLARLAKQ